MSSAPRPHENRLARETSPYLLQHKHNPVAWWPWGPEALAEAQRANKPILLSVGYAACHWCHVMAHESFEDDATAAVMNALFINIKVDREERPDIDQIYMAALHHLGEQGGWPLTMFLTPAGEPVWGGTYFPKTSRYGRAAFVDVLREVDRLFREEPGKIEGNRAALMSRLVGRARPAGNVVLGLTELDKLAEQIGGAFDQRHGGLQGAPKFPMAAMFELIWRAGRREEGRTQVRHPEVAAQRPLKGDVPNPSFEARPRGRAPQDDAVRRTPPASTNRFFNIIEATLDNICEGGIYDHLGGGFSRYSVDERWLTPHFEKMLYDNAQLLELLALAWTRTGKELYRTRAAETVGWLTREMTTPEGAFAASLDADSEGEEGKVYVWSLAEIEDALGSTDAAFFADEYDVTAGGNFEGHNILNRLRQLSSWVPASAGTGGSTNPAHSRVSGNPDGREARLSALRAKLLARRDGRIRPGLDDKVLADWNGMMIAALARAGTAFDEPAWIAMAERAFAFVAGNMTRGDRLGHSWREGRLLFPGLASDFALMIRAALALYEVTAKPDYLDRALAWQRALDRHYRNPQTGGYFLTADDAEGLVVRAAATTDDATPNANAVAAENLVRLAVLAGDEQWRGAADALFDGVLPLAAANLFGHAALLNALDLRLRMAEIVIAGEGARADELAAAALQLPYLDRVVLRAGTGDALLASHPAQEKVRAVRDVAAFVCVGETCSLPVTDARRLAAVVRGMRSDS